jgi:predicted dehydrogenase
MLRTLIVGFGRAGRELHLPALRAAREATSGDSPFEPAPSLVVDPGAAGDGDGVVRPGSLLDACRALDPERTVVHLCTPPTVRSGLLGELARNGFRKLIVEKPLAADRAELEAVAGLAARHALDVIVVGHWLASELVARLRARLDHGELGALRHLEFRQHKPRFDRTLRGDDHPTAFDVEVPHSLGLALHLAGPARLVDAGCGDMVVGGRTVPWMGRASLVLRHDAASSRIVSDLTAPLRERRAVLRLERGTLVACFPVSSSDNHAQLASYDRDGVLSGREVFADDSMARLFVDAYRWFAGAGERPASDLDLNRLVVGLLCEAKERCGAAADGQPTASDAHVQRGGREHADTLL